MTRVARPVPRSRLPGRPVAAGGGSGAGVLAIDARSARWHWGHGIGTYTAGLLSSLPALYLGYALRARGLGTPASAESLGESLDAAAGPGRGPHPPPPGDWFWQLASTAPDLLGDEALWHNPHSGIGSPETDGVRLVITVHDLIPLIMPGATTPGFLALFEEQVPHAVPRAARLIVPSEHTKADLVRLLGVDPAKVAVTGEGPSPGCRPVPRAEARARVARAFGLADPYVLYVGGFSPRKNLQGLVRAFALARPELPGRHKLAVAGGPDAAQAQVLELGHRLGCGPDVVFLGYISQADMPCLYSGADLFVYPSLYEGFGLPPLEAMACACPVVCSNTTSLPEVCGTAAALVDPRDPEALAKTIVRILLDRGLAEAMGRRGVAQAARFTWAEVARKTLAVYDETLAAESDMRRDRS